MAFANSRNEPLIDFAASIAKTANMMLQIDGSTMRVINRHQVLNPIQTVKTPQLLNLQVSPAFPIKKIYSEFEFNTAYPASQTLSQETKRVELANLSYGEELQFDALSTSDEEVQQFLRALLRSESSPQCSAEVFGIERDWLLGNRVTCFDDKKNLQAIITITSIIYSFDTERTTVSGPAEIEFIRSI